MKGLRKDLIYPFESPESLEKSRKLWKKVGTVNNGLKSKLS